MDNEADKHEADKHETPRESYKALTIGPQRNRNAQIA